jgi:hypothetical protein
MVNNQQKATLALASIQNQLGALTLLSILYNLVFKNKAPKPKQPALQHAPSALTSLYDAYKWFNRARNTQLKANSMQNRPSPRPGP